MNHLIVWWQRFTAWVPRRRKYRLVGYVHGRTLAMAGTAPMHWHDTPGPDHLALYAVEVAS